MKRAAAAAISLMTGLAMLTGCSRAEVEETIQPLVADAIEESDSEAEAVKEEDESPLIPEIDTDIKIHAGSRIAVVSKCVKGEYWKMVKKGMEDAVKEINKAYGYKKDDQITMTFEGPDNEEDVETQINTIDAVIAENPDVLCISASDMDSCEAQLEAAKENGIPVIAFDSNVAEKKLVKAYRGTDNVQVGKMAAYQLGSALGKMGKVAVFSAQQKTKSVQDRVEGFMNNIGKYGDIEVVETIYSDQVDDMEASMKEVLEKYPTLDGVFCTNADITEMYLNLEKSDEHGSQSGAKRCRRKNPADEGKILYFQCIYTSGRDAYPSADLPVGVFRIYSDIHDGRRTENTRSGCIIRRAVCFRISSDPRGSGRTVCKVSG